MNIDFGDACMRIQAGRPEEGLSIFDRILKRDSEALKTQNYRELYEEIQQRRAFALTAMGRYGDALPLLKEAVLFVTKKADLQSVHLYLGICHVEAGGKTAAKKEFAFVIGMARDLEVEAMYRLALIEYSEGIFVKARSQLEKILQIQQGESLTVPRTSV